MIDVPALKANLCSAFCQDVSVVLRGENVAIALPMDARDGDAIMAYVKPSVGGFRLSDMGTTLMRLSYEHDVSKLLTGARDKLFQTILKENGLSAERGEIYLDVPADSIARGLFVLGQGLTRIEDLALWSKTRVESTFYEDLKEVLLSFLSIDVFEEDYIVPGVPNADSYPVDYFIHTGGRPLYLFGVNSLNKARLSTIILQHLQANSSDFESLIVCANIDDIPKQDRNRLMNAANDIVPNIADTQAIRQKIEHRRRA